MREIVLALSAGMLLAASAPGAGERIGLATKETSRFAGVPEPLTRTEGAKVVASFVIDCDGKSQGKL